MKRGTLRGGKIAGITIQFDWSWFIIFALITWNLGVFLDNSHPAWGLGIIWSTALIASLSFFASLIAHELAHSLVARARGIPVNNITMFLFGGVSNIQEEPKSPSTELLLAIVGPLTSLVIGGILLYITGQLVQSSSIAGFDLNSLTQQMFSQLTPLSTMLLWLGSVNVTIGIFNLIPGFPLDGGRVLRSIIWFITGDLMTSTRWATRVGQFMGWLMITAGAAMLFGIQVPILGTGLFNGLWIGFIGWYLLQAASASYQEIVIRNALKDVTIDQIMNKDVQMVDPDMKVQDFFQKYIMGGDRRAFPVGDDSNPVGLITAMQLRNLNRARWKETTVGMVMEPIGEVKKISPEESVPSAMSRLSNDDQPLLMVYSHGKFVGLLRRRDLITWMRYNTDLKLGGR